MSHFVHRRVVVETVQQIGLRIDKFSQVESSGRYSCALLKDGISDWTVEVQASGENIEIYLRRESLTGGQQFVEVQLKVDDWMGSPFGRQSGRKSLTFRGPTDFRNVMSFKKSALSRWWFVPQDTMTIRGELTVYREVEEVVGSEEEFQAGSEKVWKIVRLLGFLCAIAAGGRFAVTAVQFAINVILPALFYVFAFFCVLMIVALMIYEVVESHMRERSNAPRGSARVHGRPDDRSLVPARNGSAVRVDSPAGQRGHGRFRQNRRMGAYDPATRRFYEYEESYTY